MNVLFDRAHTTDGALEARCEEIHIWTGKILSEDSVANAHEDHEIAAPGMRTSAILSHRAKTGCQQQTKLTDRHVSIIPAGHVYSVEWSAEAELTTITLKAAFLDALAHANEVRSYYLTEQFASVDPFLWHMARGVERQLRLRRQIEKSYIESVAVVIGQHLLSTYSDTPLAGALLGGLPRYKMRRAIDYIRNHFRDDIGFRDIARQLEMSPFHFARMFKHSTGESPHQFIMRCRIEAAKKMLIEDDMAIADVAFEVGYKSQSYFTTRFALLVGMTPAVFRGCR
jgi:AraC family transcriptional regulator